jgi:hypothetical protein
VTSTTNTAFDISRLTGVATQTVRMTPPEPVEVRVVNLSHCPHCSGTLVQPLMYQSRDFGYLLHLRCPDCGEESKGVWDDLTVEAYDRILEAGTDACIEIVEALHREVQE